MLVTQSVLFHGHSHVKVLSELLDLWVVFFPTALNFSMLGLLRRFHCLHIQLVLQAETKNKLYFQGYWNMNIKPVKALLMTRHFLKSQMMIFIWQLKKPKQQPSWLLKNLTCTKNKKIPGIDSAAECPRWWWWRWQWWWYLWWKIETSSVAQIQEASSEEESAIASDLETLSEYHLM